MVDQKSTPKKSRRWWRICHYVILGKTRPCQKMNGLHDGIKTKLAQSQEFKAPSHPNSWPEKCSVQSTVWVIACCWLITLFKGGINLFLIWVWNNHYTDLHLIWWSWKSWLPTAGTLLFFYDHLEVIWPHLSSSSAPQERVKDPFVSALLLVVSWQKYKWRWSNLPCWNVVQLWVLGSSRLGLPRKNG